MLKLERHAFIIKQLKQHRKVLSAKLSDQLQVSEDTVRRDLKELASRHLLFKVHGGALTIENKILSFDERSVADLDKKRSIAKKAVHLIHDGQVIIMSGSTVNVELAKIIPSHIRVTIFTYSLPIAIELSHHESIEVIFIGGKLNKLAQVTVGIDVVNSVSNIRADICFMGVSGMDVVRGMTEPDWEVAHIKKCMIAASDYVVALCQSSKLNKIERYVVVPTQNIDTVIIDEPLEEDVLKPFEEQGVQFV
ncbi:DeoR/GlpR family DNA-binding transcription regulator [Flavobacteriaceae bacterium F08102]|nr:DeoR/GlpR family DNA-binding transcription regulator [Flavobacteriaceae bacterium F08102]